MWNTGSSLQQCSASAASKLAPQDRHLLYLAMAHKHFLSCLTGPVIKGVNTGPLGTLPQTNREVDFDLLLLLECQSPIFPLEMFSCHWCKRRNFSKLEFNSVNLGSAWVPKESWKVDVSRSTRARLRAENRRPPTNTIPREQCSHQETS